MSPSLTLAVGAICVIIGMALGLRRKLSIPGLLLAFILIIFGLMAMSVGYGGEGIG